MEDFEYRPEPEYDLIKLIISPESETLTMAGDMLEKTDKNDLNTLDFIETVLVYKFPNLSLEEIKNMLHLNNVELKQTRFYQDVAAIERQEGRLEGKLEGKLKGIEVGKKEGKNEGKQELFLCLLKAKFGDINLDLQAKIQQASSEQIETWTAQIFQAESPAFFLHS